MNTVTLATQTLTDQDHRDRFGSELDRNFSVIAPAGVGKTRAIVERIVALATDTQGHYDSVLPRLVVVTYTHKAADEMYQRVRQELMRKKVSASCLSLFHKAFFGTIHSFCMNLLRGYGYRMGLSGNFELVRDENALWLEFVRRNDSFLSLLESNSAKKLHQYLSVRDVLNLARMINPDTDVMDALPACPNPNLRPLLDYIPNPAHSANIIEQQETLKFWLENTTSGELALGIPDINKGERQFKALWAETIYPLWMWLGNASLALAIKGSQAYRDFRISKNLINYNDMVSLAKRLLQDPEIGKDIRAQKYHIILDEAQDTDDSQFAVLLAVAQSPSDFNSGSLPEPGRFCMVGDPQQAIYSSRADPATYVNIHNWLVENNAADALTFCVTMRCDEEIVDHVNHIFPSILSSQEKASQTDFVPLTARPWAGPGYVGKIQINCPDDTQSILNSNDLLKWEADVLTKWIQERGPQGLGIEHWHEVALLCPRKSWLSPFEKAFSKLGILCQLHSKDDLAGDNPAFAWLTALMTIAASPCDSFEITGALREIFGLSDHDIAVFVQERKDNNPENTEALHPLNIAQSSEGSGPVSEVLNLLYQIRKDSLARPLRDCVMFWIEKTQLIERLASLPNDFGEEQVSFIDKLLLKATVAEENGFSIAEWAHELRETFSESVDELPPQKDHVQLYTCHKAKGLEWPVVIIPCFFKSIKFPTPPYPQLYNFGSNEPLVVAINNHPAKREWEEKLKLRRQTELERLLYVAATRARQTLLWVDDEALFSNPKNSFAELFQSLPGGNNRKTWLALPVPSSLEKPMSSCADFPNDAESVPIIKPFDVTLTTLARKSATNYPRRILPSSLDSRYIGYPKSKDIPTAYDRKFAKAYGNWWHSMMETTPWTASKATWLQHMQDVLPKCPDPDRGEKEVNGFLTSEVPSMLEQQELIIKTEVPFLWKNPQGNCVEGNIDLVVLNTQTNEWFIIDWKTDHVEEASIAELKTLHAQQLNTYQKALSAIYNNPVRAFLYSTYQSELIEVEL